MAHTSGNSLLNKDVTEFKGQYRNTTSADWQTFIIGWGKGFSAISNEYDQLKAELEAVKQREAKLREAAKGIIDNWEERMGGDTEVYKNPDNSISGEGYYSPSASMVSSSFIANLRKALEQNKALNQ